MRFKGLRTESERENKGDFERVSKGEGGRVGKNVRE